MLKNLSSATMAKPQGISGKIFAHYLMIVDDESILLVEGEEIISDDEGLAKVFNNYFNRVTDSLEIPVIPKDICDSSDTVSSAIHKCASHPSIIQM